MTKFIYKRAGNGEICSKEFAEQNPDITMKFRLDDNDDVKELLINLDLLLTEFATYVIIDISNIEPTPTRVKEFIERASNESPAGIVRDLLKKHGFKK